MCYIRLILDNVIEVYMLNKDIKKITNKFKGEDAVAEIIIQTVINYYMVNTLTTLNYQYQYPAYLYNVLHEASIPNVDIDLLHKKRYGICQRIIHIIQEDRNNYTELFGNPTEYAISDIMKILFDDKTIDKIFETSKEQQKA